MTKTGHKWTGLGTGIGVAGLSPDFELVGVVLAIIGGVSGGTAPDWLEISSWRRSYPNTLLGWLSLEFTDTRTSLIPHRRITHWVLAWAVLMSVSVFLIENSLLQAYLIGFSAGGLTHLLVDVPNPMGVPVWHPWRRTSLR